MSGWFGLLGSGEFEDWSAQVDQWLLDRATGDGRILVVPTASAPEGEDVFEDWAERGAAHYTRLGMPVTILPVRDRVDADDMQFASMVVDASMVFFSGGNPAYLAQTLRDTALWVAINRGLDRGMAYAGCSAGMACLGTKAPDSTVDELSDELWQLGLSLFPHGWLGPHWDMLDRYVEGLIDHIVATVPVGDVLVGVDENTAMVGDGRSWEVLGRGQVHVYEGESRVAHPAGQKFACDLLGRG
jgi:cyanophycinase